MRTILVLALLALFPACSSSGPIAGRPCGGNASNSPGPCPAGYSCV